MVTFDTGNGIIEVRLVKAATYARNESLDEYCPCDEPDIPQRIMTRYILAEHNQYGVEITLRKGFSHGYYDGAFIVIMKDMETGKEMLKKKLFQKEITLKKPAILDRNEEVDFFTRDIIMNKEVAAMNPPLGLGLQSSGKLEHR